MSHLHAAATNIGGIIAAHPWLGMHVRTVATAVDLGNVADEISIFRYGVGNKAVKWASNPSFVSGDYQLLLFKTFVAGQASRLSQTCEGCGQKTNHCALLNEQKMDVGLSVGD